MRRIFASCISDAYELVLETAGKGRGGCDRMEHIRTEGSSQIDWVSKEVAFDTSYVWDIVQV